MSPPFQRRYIINSLEYLTRVIFDLLRNLLKSLFERKLAEQRPVKLSPATPIYDRLFPRVILLPGYHYVTKACLSKSEQFTTILWNLGTMNNILYKILLQKKSYALCFFVTMCLSTRSYAMNYTASRRHCFSAYYILQIG